MHLLCTGKQVTQVHNRYIRNKTILTTFKAARLHSKQTIIKKLLHTGTYSVNAPVHLLCKGKQVTQVHNRQIRMKKLLTTFEAARLHSRQTIIKKLLHTGT